MIPGTQSKLSESVVASATSISVKTDVVRITGSTTIQTILSPLMGSSTMVVLIPVDGAVTLGTSGNILVGIVMAVNRPYTMFWSKTVGKWYIGATTPT
jgi:hypothetical protein